MLRRTMKFFIFLSCLAFAIGDEDKFFGQSDKVFFDISVNGYHRGRVEIILFGQIVPKTVDNFIQLCTRPEGRGYSGSRIHRISENQFIQGGDYENGDGTGGSSAYAHSFLDENFIVTHSYEGTISMANRGPNTAGSQFFITLASMEFVDGQHVAFGRVSSGIDLLKEIGRFAASDEGRPYADVIITECGLIPL